SGERPAGIARTRGAGRAYQCGRSLDCLECRLDPRVPVTDPVFGGAMTLLESLTGPGDLRQLSIEQLGELAAEIRQAIIDQVSTTGGHLAPNLGVVELTLALHRVFDFGHDRL